MGGDMESVICGFSNVSQREKGFVMCELWGEVLVKIGFSGFVFWYFFEDDVELVKVKVLMQYFQKLKGELVEVFVDRQEKFDELIVGWEKNDLESFVFYVDFFGQLLGIGKYEIKFF